MKVVATETCHGMGGRGKEKKKGLRGGRGQLRGNAGKGGSQRPSSISPGLAGVDGKLEGKVHSADCLVGQCTGGQVAMHIKAIHPSQV